MCGAQCSPSGHENFGFRSWIWNLVLKSSDQSLDLTLTETLSLSPSSMQKTESEFEQELTDGSNEHWCSREGGTQMKGPFAWRDPDVGSLFILRWPGGTSLCSRCSEHSMRLTDRSAHESIIPAVQVNSKTLLRRHSFLKQPIEPQSCLKAENGSKAPGGRWEGG